MLGDFDFDEPLAAPGPLAAHEALERKRDKMREQALSLTQGPARRLINLAHTTWLTKMDVFDFFVADYDGKSPFKPYDGYVCAFCGDEPRRIEGFPFRAYVHEEGCVMDNVRIAMAMTEEMSSGVYTTPSLENIRAIVLLVNKLGQIAYTLNRAKPWSVPVKALLNSEMHLGLAMSLGQSAARDNHWVCTCCGGSSLHELGFYGEPWAGEESILHEVGCVENEVKEYLLLQQREAALIDYLRRYALTLEEEAAQARKAERAVAAVFDFDKKEGDSE